MASTREDAGWRMTALVYQATIGTVYITLFLIVAGLVGGTIALLEAITGYEIDETTTKERVDPVLEWYGDQWRFATYGGGDEWFYPTPGMREAA
jgi:hypothetical protein